jgi:hypothetical protein
VDKSNILGNLFSKLEMIAEISGLQYLKSDNDWINERLSTYQNSWRNIT